MSVRLGSHSIEIDGREETINLESADITLAGQEKHRVRVQAPDGSLALIFNDVQVLKELRQVSGSKTFADKLDKLIAEAIARPGKDKKYWLTVFSAVVAFCLAIYISFGTLVDLAVDRIDPSMEAKLGEILATNKEWKEDIADAQRVKRIGERLVKEVPTNKFKFRYFIDESPEVNAYACPGGMVVVNRGLLNKVKSDDELAGVLAHEISHVNHRDSLRGAVRSLGVTAVLGIIFSGAANDERIATIAQMTKLGQKLESLSFSRKQEADADLSGVQLVYKAGYDPDAFVKFFQDMMKSPEWTSNEKLFAILSNHPMTAERIAAIKAEIERLNAAKKASGKTT